MPDTSLEHQLEATLFYKNEPLTFATLAKLLQATEDEIRVASENLREHYAGRGICLVTSGDEIALSTSPDLSGLIESLAKEALARDIGRAGLETLAIVLYKGPVSRREIDYIRGVNSGFILRHLLVRGLVERVDVEGERSFGYRATIDLLRHLGITRREELPEFKSAYQRLERFVSEPVDSAGADKQTAS